ncbi:hypothetical protein E1181_09025 [Saccharopolyspora terrae]|uniref:Uncharacterized protein n=1 Tax=Saccharopolyspora terrae TaxID=2530384 RepID=A0A4R4VP01_9PSEU|nr:DUF6541 family protein [Saccharopolyspora terrae]TDD07559.1 hypothetical protein E1181_09025 [Saccharopolyspora terrae]
MTGLASVSWLAATPAVLAAAVTLVLAGVPACYALGLRGIAAWGTAPLVPPAVIATAAVVTAPLNVRWSPSAAAAALAAFTILVLLGSWLWAWTGRGSDRPVSDPARTRLAAGIGVLVAVVIGSVVLVRGFGAPDVVSWTWDTTFHYSALAQILDSGDASSLSLGALGDPRAESGFYPAAWFDIASVVIMSTGAPLHVAANATAGTIAVLVWPLSCLFLARQVFGRAPVPLLLTSGLALAFGSFPWGLFYWGALWPYSLGQALVPVGLGLVLSLTGLAVSDSVGRGRAAVLLPVLLLALGLAHTGALFGLAVLAVFPVGWVLAEWARGAHRTGRTVRAVLTLLGVLVAASAAFVAVSSTATVQDMAETNWPPSGTASAAVGEFLLNGTNGARALWALSAVIVIGAVSVWRARSARWIVAAHLGIGLLYVMTAGVQSSTTKLLTAFWFNDSHRFAAMLPTTGALLATFGIVALATSLQEWAERRAWFREPRLHRLATVGSVVLVVLVLLGLTKGLYQGRNALTLQHLHRPSADLAFKFDFYQRVKNRIPEDAVVANNPEDASPFLWSMFHRQVLFPHINGSGNPNQQFLADHLHEAMTNPRVCQVAGELNVRFLLIDPVPTTRRIYRGLEDPVRRPGFELVESNGLMKLYKISACDPDGAPNMPHAGR